LLIKAVFDASEGPWQCDFNPYLSTTSPTPSLVALPTSFSEAKKRKFELSWGGETFLGGYSYGKIHLPLLGWVVSLPCT
jgi:hypothetical protein